MRDRGGALNITAVDIPAACRVCGVEAPEVVVVDAGLGTLFQCRACAESFMATLAAEPAN